jgi:pilus assembly protein CpaE
MSEKILIVDDDLETLRLVGLMLQRQGYQIVAANNGNQGINLAKTEKPDLIVLDVMMPDMDGYTVTRELRKDPDIADTPILMFTAKSQVDDKVAGYEAGVDDYLTKPVHPVELVAHIKALLARRKPSKAPEAPPVQKGYTIGVMAAKGGLGVSTVALNLAIALFERTKSDIIAAEMLPGSGTWGMELGYADSQGLSNLLKNTTSMLSDEIIEENLIRTTFGPRLLLSTAKSEKIDFNTLVTQIETITQKLSKLCQLVILDIGTPYNPFAQVLLKQCQEVILVTESQPISIQKTKLLIDELEKTGFGKNKLLNVVILNRVRADIQLTQPQIQEKLGINPLLVIPPAPEQSYQAANHFQPLIKIQGESLISQQIYRLSENFTNRIKK